MLRYTLVTAAAIVLLLSSAAVSEIEYTEPYCLLKEFPDLVDSEVLRIDEPLCLVNSVHANVTIYDSAVVILPGVIGSEIHNGSIVYVSVSDGASDTFVVAPHVFPLAEVTNGTVMGFVWRDGWYVLTDSGAIPQPQPTDSPTDSPTDTIPCDKG